MQEEFVQKLHFILFLAAEANNHWEAHGGDAYEVCASSQV